MMKLILLFAIAQQAAAVTLWVGGDFQGTNPRLTQYHSQDDSWTQAGDNQPVFDDKIRDIVFSGSDVYLAGYFDTPPEKIVRYNRLSDSWVSLPAGPDNNNGFHLSESDGEILFSGSFTSPSNLEYFTVWNSQTSSWIEMGTEGVFDDKAQGSIPTDDGVYVYGNFNLPYKYIAFRNLTGHWVSLGTTPAWVGSKIRTAVIVGDLLYVAGDFTAPWSYCAQYHIPTQTWSAIPNTPAFDDIIYKIYVTPGDQYLIFAGDFTAPESRIIKYEIATQTWYAIGSTPPVFDDVVRAVVMYDDYIYIGGEFSTPWLYMAQYSISLDTWSALPNQPAFDDKVYSIVIETCPLCQNQNVPGNGTMVCQGDGCGEECYFSCNAGFVMVGNPAMSCSASGWNVTEPTCVFVPPPPTPTPTPAPTCDSCSNPMLLDGMVICQGEGCEKECSFICNPGYHLEGAGELSCLINGWDNEIPLCRIDEKQPVIREVAPSLSVLAGRRTIIVGDGFDKDCQVTVDGVPARNITYDGVDLLQVNLPPQEEGYHTLTITNPNRLFDSYPDLYYTDDCPIKGSYGRGTDCHPCPTGATCPGGYRVWPNPGWWNSGEHSPNVQRCSPPAEERCLGGRYSACASQYRGDYCAQCAPDHYMQYGECYSCPDGGYVFTLLLIANLAYITVFILAVVFCQDKTLSMVATILFALQTIRIATKSGVSDLGDGYRHFSLIFALISFDIEFLYPGCQISGIYAVQFWANIIISVVTIALTLITLTFLQYARIEHATFYKNRKVRAHCVIYTITFITAISCCLMGIACDKNGRLIGDYSVKCYQAEHLPIGIMSWISLVLYLGGVLVIWYIIIYKMNKKDELSDDNTIAKFGYLYEEYKSDKYWFYFLQMFTYTLSTIVNTTMIRMPMVQFVCTLVVQVFFLSSILFLRPMLSMWKNILIGGFVTISIVVTIFKKTSQSVSEKYNNILGSLIIVFIVVSIVVLVCQIVRQWWLKQHQVGKINDIEKIDDYAFDDTTTSMGITSTRRTSINTILADISASDFYDISSKTVDLQADPERLSVIDEISEGDAVDLKDFTSFHIDSDDPNVVINPHFGDKGEYDL